MKIWAKILTILTILTVCVSFSLTANAHAGRTDGRGGHTDHASGEYHYHHGYPAHDHYDMDGDGVIDCPYDFDDKTGEQSGTSSTNSERNSSSSAKELSYTIKSAAEIHNAILSRENMIETLFLSFITLLFAGPIIFVLYTLSAFLLRIPCSWLWKLVLPSLSENKNYSWSIVTANIILAVIIYVILLFPTVEFLISTPNVLASCIIILGLVLFIGVFCSVKVFKENDSLYSALGSQKRIVSDLESRLEAALAENKELKDQTLLHDSALLKKDNTIIELQKKNRALEEQINTLYASIYRAQSINNESISPSAMDIPNILPKDIYLVHGNIPVKGEITDRKPYGDYTVYVAKTGHCYHSDYLCGNGYLKSAHIFKVYEKKSQCLRCMRALPEGLPSWYTSNRDFFF